MLWVERWTQGCWWMGDSYPGLWFVASHRMARAVSPLWWPGLPELWLKWGDELAREAHLSEVQMLIREALGCGDWLDHDAMWQAPPSDNHKRCENPASQSQLTEGQAG